MDMVRSVFTRVKHFILVLDMVRYTLKHEATAADSDIVDALDAAVVDEEWVQNNNSFMLIEGWWWPGQYLV